jgi:hypothetical protein
MVAIGTVVGGEVLMTEAKGIAHLMEEEGNGAGLTRSPKSLSPMAILVVRRDHFRPAMGSPALSYSSRNSIRVTMSAFFSRGLPTPPACRARPGVTC